MLSYKIVKAMGNKYDKMSGGDISSEAYVDKKWVDSIEQDSQKPVSEEGKKFLDFVRNKYSNGEVNNINKS